MSDIQGLLELKLKAKWSSNNDERMAAIKKLSTFGQIALPSLEEIMAVTAYEDIRAACIEAIRSARAAK